MNGLARALVAPVLICATACQETTGAPATKMRPSFDAAMAATCPTNPTVTVVDETDLRAALAAARLGDVIAIGGMIDISEDDTIAVDGVTLTCATPGSGLVASGSDVMDMLTIVARGDVVTGLTLDGTQAGDSPYLAINDGVAVFAQDAQFTRNTVTCTFFGECVFFAGGTGAVVTDNLFTSDAAVSGIQLQSNGPVQPPPLPIRVDGARIERNTIVATSPSGGGIFGGIRPFDASGIVIADNVVTGPWRRSISATAVSDSRIMDNRLEGAVFDGIRTSLGGLINPAGLVVRNVFTGNIVTSAGRAGIFAQLACANKFLANDLGGNAGGVGLILNDFTGANVVAGVNNATVVDNGAFDCDGDGTIDPNIVTGGVRHGSPAVDSTSDVAVPRRIRGVTPL